MNTFSLLVLIVYVTIMVYVVYKARESVVEEQEKRQQEALAGKIVVTLDGAKLQGDLDRQIEELDLKGAISIKIPQDPVVDVTQFAALPLEMDNQTSTYAIYVDWQQSSLTTLNGSAQELACLTPHLGQSQSPSLLPPNEKLREVFLIATTEDEVIPLVPPEILILLSKKVPCEIFLRLVLKFQEVGRYQNAYLVVVSCPCRFRLPTLQDLPKK